MANVIDGGIFKLDLNCRRESNMLDDDLLTLAYNLGFGEPF